MRKFTLIAAVTENMGMGQSGGLPWRKFPKDMNWFRRQTQGQTVIMGRCTWESIGSKPLPKRNNIVISSQASRLQKDYLKLGSLSGSSVDFHSNFNSALSSVKTDKTYVIGGSRLYQESMEHDECDSVLITHVGLKTEVDTFFPNLTQGIFRISDIIESGTDNITLNDGMVTENAPYEIVEYSPLRSVRPGGEQGYLWALRNIIENGEVREDRTGVGTKALFGMTFRYNLLEQGYPLFTTKKMFTRGIFEELLWFLCGDTNVANLRSRGVHIWDGNSTREFLNSRGLVSLPEWQIGPAYGHQFRYAGAPYVNAETDYRETGGVDQLAEVIRMLREEPESRRIMINLWNVKDLKQMALPPCLFLYHFWVSEGQYLNLSLYQRSGDMGLGVPFNVASASLLMHILGRLTGLIPKELIHNIGDAHVYVDHIEPLRRQISRVPRPFPRLRVVHRDQEKVEDFKVSDFMIEGYYPYPGIKMKMAV